MEASVSYGTTYINNLDTLLTTAATQTAMWTTASTVTNA
jgi:hypothetical protein